MPAGTKRDFSLGFRQFCLFESSPFHVLAKQSHPSLAGGHVIFEVKQTEGRNKIREDKTLVLYSFLCLLLLSPVHMLLNPTKNSISSLIYFAFMYVFLKISSLFSDPTSTCAVLAAGEHGPATRLFSAHAIGKQTLVLFVLFSLLAG